MKKIMKHFNSYNFSKPKVCIILGSGLGSFQREIKKKVINPKPKFKFELESKKYNKINTLFILSVDFSHFLPMQEALEKENCAAHSLMFKKHNTSCINVVDDIRTFNKFYELKHENLLNDCQFK